MTDLRNYPETKEDVEERRRYLRNARLTVFLLTLSFWLAVAAAYFAHH